MLETIFALIVRILSNPIANIIQKRLSCRHSAIIINLYSYVFLTLFCLPYLISNNWYQYGLEYWIYVSFAGLLCTLGSVCLIKALQYGEISVLGPINSYKCFVGLLISYIVLGEVPDIAGLLGMILIIFGSWFIFDTVQEGFSFKLLLRKDIVLRFCALFFTGCEAVLLKKIILMSSIQESFVLWCLTGLFFTIVLIFIFNIKPKKFIVKDTGGTFIIALSLGLMQYSTNVVFKHINVGLSLALFQLSSIITVFAGYFMFKEDGLIKKLIGTVIMIIGSCFILL